MPERIQCRTPIAMPKNMSPVPTAIIVIILTNRSISLAIGVFSALILVTSRAMSPITVRSPVATAIPKPLPSTQFVERKMPNYGLLKGFSWPMSGDRVNGSDSPVSEELSTFMLSDFTIRMSAGTLSPLLQYTRSPTTIWSAGISPSFTISNDSRLLSISG